ncbi:MAG TPA: hypothetical protein VKA27_10405 [Sunxiuqinia sp.]|nr:hypothetical protein [Sunxiuqinia sp.]
MKKLLLFILITFLFGQLKAQTRLIEFPGKVSYVTAQNIYVRFDGTNNIQVGDTVFVRRNQQVQPLLIVESKSSLSCVGKPLNGIEVSMGDEVFAHIAVPEKKAVEVAKEKLPSKMNQQKVVKQPATQEENLFREKIYGRISASSYSSFSKATTSNSTRLRYNLSLKADHINNSCFSADVYTTFTHLANDWTAVQGNLFNALKIYSFALKYEPGKQSQVWLGRKINLKLASIGAIDGLQYETGLKNFRFGAVVGFRPDYKDYSLNTKLLEYGGYVSHEYKTETGSVQTSLAVFEQENSGKTDRRFAYFQHSNSLLKNLFFFVSSEIDLYKLQNGIPTNTISLTSLYTSLRFRVSRRLSFYASYDNRKNVIYYETFKSLVDQLLTNANRQGVQLRVRVRPAKFMMVGLTGGYRMRDNDIRPTKTLNGFASFSHIPWINASATCTANILHTSYVDGTILGVRFYKDLLNGKIYTSLGYRHVNYDFLSSTNSMFQHLGEVDVTWRILKKLSLSANYEGTFEKTTNYNRIYLNLTKRF